jgi:hypothetical protein
MANVAFVHPQVKALLSSYEQISDCLAGEARVKHRREKYLPRPEGNTPDNVTRYQSYLTRAVFYNVAQRTLGGMVGQVFLRDPTIEVPQLLDNVITDATGSGVPLAQLAQQACGFGVSHGRCGLYVDYPSVLAPVDPGADPAAQAEDVAPAATVAQLESGEVRPVLKIVAPSDGINWRVKKRGAKIILSLVVFREDAIVSDDGFETKTIDQWRVLRLDPVTDEYIIEIYRNRNGTKPDETYFPTDATGSRLREIPFTFIGAVNNEPTPGPMPMYDLCSVNIAHYRNSADYEEAVYMLGQPTAWFGGLTEEWVKNVMGGTVALGSRSVIPLPANSSAGLLQVQPNTMAKEAMDQKEAQMLALGAKLVEGSQVQRTATEANIDNVSETSILSTVATNVGAAFKFGLTWAARFAGADENAIEFDLNTEFDLVNLTPEERKTLLAEWQAGGIVTEEYRSNLRRAGIATLDDAAFESTAAAEDAKRMAQATAEAAALHAATGGNDNPPPGGN